MSHQNGDFWQYYFDRHGQTKITTENSQPCRKRRYYQLSPDICGFSVAYLVCPWRSKQNCQKITNFDVKLKENQNWQFLAILFWSPWVNQMCNRKSTTIWRKLIISSFSTWLWIYCSSFSLLMVIKTILPKITNFDVTWVTPQNQIVGLY